MEKETTPSAATGNNENVITMEEAGVTQAYADWLNEILPKFYKIQGENGGEPNKTLVNEEVLFRFSFTCYPKNHNSKCTNVLPDNNIC